jgi:hypothetical protein
MALETGTPRTSSAGFLVSLVVALAGCSGIEFGRPEQKPVDPNVYPTNYKTDLVAYVKTHPAEMLNARGAYISAPALKQVGSESRYFVCLRVDGQDWRQEKMVIFYSGGINQFVDATSEHCGAAAYQSFPELLTMLSQLGGKK